MPVYTISVKYSIHLVPSYIYCGVSEVNSAKIDDEVKHIFLQYVGI